jgi:hypothetical protein
VTMPANASRLSALGSDTAAMDKMGRRAAAWYAAAGVRGGFAEAGTGVGMAAVWSLTRRSSPRKGDGAALGRSVLGVPPGGCDEPDRHNIVSPRACTQDIVPSTIVSPA